MGAARKVEQLPGADSLGIDSRWDSSLDAQPAAARYEPSSASEGTMRSDTAAVCPQLPGLPEPQQAPCLKVPSMTTISPFFGAGLSGAASADSQQLDTGPARLPGLSPGSSMQQMLDAQVPVVEMDSRRGSPCQRAAAELMEPADVGISGRDGSQGLGSTVSQTLEDSFPSGPLPGLSGSSAQAPARADSTAPIPGMHSQPDWFATMLEQAQGVGLWGGAGSGNSAGERLQRAPSPPSGLPSLAHTHASRGGKQEGGSAVSLYELSMAAMLPPPRRGHAWDGGQPPRSQGLGVIDRAALAADDRSNQPRLVPVSLGMAASSIQAAFAGRQHASGAGPFRPSTRPREHFTQGDMLQHPMLQQSRLQLSLGLSSEAPLDLQAWGYGGGTCDPAETSLASGGTATVFATTDGAADAGTELPPPQQHSAPGPSPPASLPVSPSAQPRPSPFSAGVSAATHFQQARNLAAAAGEELRSQGRAESLAAAAGAPSGPPPASEESGSRAECLERYREKKRRRLFSKTIRYHKRKVNADKRPRVKGRFVKAEAPAEAVPSEEQEDASLLSGMHD